MKERLQGRPSIEHRGKIEAFSGISLLEELAHDYGIKSIRALIQYPNIRLAEFAARSFQDDALEKYRKKYDDVSDEMFDFAMERLDLFGLYVQGKNTGELARVLEVNYQAVNRRIQKALRDIYDDSSEQVRKAFSPIDIFQHSSKAQKITTLLREGISLDEISKEGEEINTKLIEEVRKQLNPEERYELRDQLYDPNYRLHLQRSKRLQDLMKVKDFNELRVGLQEFSDTYCLQQRRKGHPFFIPISEVIPGYPNSNKLHAQKAAQVLEDSGIPVRIIISKVGEKTLRYYLVPSPIIEEARSILRENYSELKDATK